jgi:crossover junction endodeoxyribonuclease RuvC
MFNYEYCRIIPFAVDLFMMKILGVDPGTIVMGYGVILSEGDKIELISYGAIKTKGHTAISDRLSLLYRELNKVIAKYKPDVVAIEQPFVAKNVSSALAVGRAQAVAILAAANSLLPSFEYTPSQVKQRVSNYGASSKEQIQEMVRLQLGLSIIPEPSDAADALAVALCHLQEVHLNQLLAESD